MKTLTKKELQMYAGGSTCTVVTTTDGVLAGIAFIAIPLGGAIAAGAFAIFGAAFCPDGSPLDNIPPDTHSNNHTRGPR